MANFECVRSCGDITEYRLSSNGLKLLFLEMHEAPVVTLMITYGVGSRDEAADVRGGTHLIEHMMFKGTARFNKRNGTAIHDVLGAMGGQLNATTWLDYTNYFSVVPSSQWKLAAEIEADRMRGMLLAEPDLEAERDVVLNEHDQLVSSPFERLNQSVWSAALSGHAYSRPVIGARQDIAGLTRAALLRHYDRYYWPDNATVTVFGDASARDVLETVGDLFGHLSRGHSPEVDNVPENAESRSHVEVRLPGVPTSVVLAYRSPHGLHPDTDALELLAIILATGRSSRMHRQLVPAGLATDAWSSTSRLRSNGLFQVQALLPEGGSHVQAEQQIRDLIDEVCRTGIEEAELERAKGYARGRLLGSRDGAIGMAMQLNQAIAMGDWTHYVMAAERLAAVSAADVQLVANRYLAAAEPTVGVLLAEEGVGH